MFVQTSQRVKKEILLIRLSFFNRAKTQCDSERLRRSCVIPHHYISAPQSSTSLVCFRSRLPISWRQSKLRIKSKRFHIKTLFKMTDIQQLEGDIYLSVYLFIYLKHTATPFAQQRLLIMPKLLYSPVGIRPSIKQVQAIYI